jgi:hypothetical protein
MPNPQGINQYSGGSGSKPAPRTGPTGVKPVGAAVAVTTGHAGAPQTVNLPADVHQANHGISAPARENLS